MRYLKLVFLILKLYIVITAKNTRYCYVSFFQILNIVYKLPIYVSGFMKELHFN